MIHIRIEEKFGEYRKAFRAFDLNKDNDLSFDEFVSGCEFCGIRLSVHDFKLVYETIDYDNNEGIDFDKFCFLNSDRTKNIIGYIDENFKGKEKARENHDNKLLPSAENSDKPPIGKKHDGQFVQINKETKMSKLMHWRDTDGLAPKFLPKNLNTN